MLWAIAANKAAVSGRLTSEGTAAEHGLLAFTTTRAPEKSRGAVCVSSGWVYGDINHTGSWRLLSQGCGAAGRGPNSWMQTGASLDSPGNGASLK